MADRKEIELQVSGIGRRLDDRQRRGVPAIARKYVNAAGPSIARTSSTLRNVARLIAFR